MPSTKADTTPYWATTATFPPFPKLSEDLVTDVVVVGAGVTGLTAAYLLAKAGTRVVVLEREVDLPGGPETAHCFCVHLGLTGGGRRRQMEALADRVESIVPPGAPLIIAGDFNDWRLRADQQLAPHGLREAFEHRHGKPARSFPARLPWLRLDRIYTRNASAYEPQVLSTRPWSHLSDHAPLAAEIHL